jgi:hypothetical protein
VKASRYRKQSYTPNIVNMIALNLSSVMLYNYSKKNLKHKKVVQIPAQARQFPSSPERPAPL